MKFPSASGDIITVHNDQQLAREYYISSLRQKSQPSLPIILNDSREQASP